MGFLSKIWVIIRGFFIRSGDDLVSNSPDAIRSTYASAIEDSKKRYRQMVEAVSLLAREREKSETKLKDLENEKKEMHRRLDGALDAAQAAPNDLAHREAGSRYLERIKAIEAEQLIVEQNLQTQSLRVEEYKTQIRGFSDEIDRLKREQGEMVAEFVSSQQIISLENRLQGLGESSVDESLVAIREKVGTMRARAKIASEMGKATVQSQDRVYEDLGARQEAANRFDELLKGRQKGVISIATESRSLG
jgi:phage shock protein A